MPCLLIFGDTGMGKTKIVRKFERMHPPTFCQATGVTRRPVIVAQVSGARRARSLSRAARQRRCPGARRRDPGAGKGRVPIAASNRGARMIVLDEVNGMLAGTYRQQRVFLNALRFLANDLRAPLVCAGTDLARQALLDRRAARRAFRGFSSWTLEERSRLRKYLLEEPNRHFASAPGFGPGKRRGLRCAFTCSRRA